MKAQRPLPWLAIVYLGSVCTALSLVYESADAAQWLCASSPFHLSCTKAIP